MEELEKLVKEFWKQCDKFRINEGNIEFSLPCSNGSREWFNICRSPEKVEKFVISYIKLNRNIIEITCDSRRTGQ